MSLSRVCSRCKEQAIRGRGQRLCRECHSADMRLRREKVMEMRADAQHQATWPRGPLAGVYFVRSGEFVKIGIANDVRRRFQQLQCANPKPLVPLGFIPEPMDAGAEASEVTLHQRFRQDHYRGEWFRCSDDLAAFISAEAKSWPE